MYKNLVLSGGSIKGIAYLGALKRLVELGLVQLDKLEAIAGTSVGSILATLIVIGFTVDQIWEFMLMIDFKKMVSPDILQLLEKFGMDTGDKFYHLTQEILRRATGLSCVTFRKLYECTHKKLIIVGSCLTTREIVYYDHERTPEFEVALAVRISISMPFYFTPVEVEGRQYIDGCILNNYPINLFEKEMETTIGMIIKDEHAACTTFQYPEQYLRAVVNLFLYNYYKETHMRYQNNTIYIDDDPDVSIFDFNLDNAIKRRLFQRGVEAVEKFLERRKRTKD
jgi:NTE family protein